MKWAYLFILVDAQLDGSYTINRNRAALSSPTSALPSLFRVTMTHTVPASWRLNCQEPIFLPSLLSALKSGRGARLLGPCPNLMRASPEALLKLCDHGCFSARCRHCEACSTWEAGCLSLRSHCLLVHPAHLLSLFVYFFPVFLQHFLPLCVGVENLPSSRRHS